MLFAFAVTHRISHAYEKLMLMGCLFPLISACNWVRIYFPGSDEGKFCSPSGATPPRLHPIRPYCPARSPPPPTPGSTSCFPPASLTATVYRSLPTGESLLMRKPANFPSLGSHFCLFLPPRHNSAFRTVSISRLRAQYRGSQLTLPWQ